MRSQVCGTVLLMGMVMSGGALAHPLTVAPYSSERFAQSVIQAGFQFLPPVNDSVSPLDDSQVLNSSKSEDFSAQNQFKQPVVQDEPKLELVVPVYDSAISRVPQPGDPYFDPPSQDRLMMAVEEEPVQEEPVQEVLEFDVLQEIPAESVASSSEVRGDVLSGDLNKENAVAEVQGEPYEPLVVRMSDHIGGEVLVSEDEPVLLVPSSFKESLVEDVLAAESTVSVEEAPILDVSPPVFEKPEEIIVWNGDRVPVNTPIPVADFEPASGTEQVDVVEGVQWRALEGQNIRQTLEQWSQAADVALIWDNVNAFAVLEPFEIRGDYEQAVQMLLDQYMRSDVRPVATLHLDPENQQKTLVVRIVEGG
ncbi:MAG: TcpQ domain-containing protein [Rhodospirillales bacterium]|nr:TcpQ domain-containing protein [Rhodospirillales bacterium]